MKKILLTILLSAVAILQPLAIKADLKNSTKHSYAQALTEAGDIAPEYALQQSFTNYDERVKTTYDNYMEAYYSGLTTNMGENYKNSCGYVSLGMLLSYYDSYLNDNIIPEKYDVKSEGNETNMISRNNSPGVYHDVISGATEMSATQYYNKILTMKDYSLHAKLMTIGKDLNVLNLSDGNDLGVTNEEERVRILRAYLSEIGITKFNINRAQYESSHINPTDEEVKSFVKRNLDEGRPVLVSAKVSETSNLGHAMICYAYSGSTFYGNMGWTTKADYAHYPITKDYKFFTGAMVIDFNIEQKPGLNYAVTQDGKTKTYGYNDPSILTYTNEITSFTPADNFDGNLVICKDYVRIENAAFFGCTELKSVKFETGSRMQTIGGYAFQECTNLTNVVVPKSVTSMGWSVFVFCDKLYTIRCQSSGPNTDWDPTWNVKYIDYDAMFEDSMNGIQKDPSAYYTYFNVIWNYS